jgi:hypothetical protein
MANRHQPGDRVDPGNAGAQAKLRHQSEQDREQPGYVQPAGHHHSCCLAGLFAIENTLGS